MVPQFLKHWTQSSKTASTLAFVVLAITCFIVILLNPDIAQAQTGYQAHLKADGIGGASTLQQAIYSFVVGAFGYLTMMGGWVLDTSVQWFIREFATLYLTGYGYAIENVWGAIRDLMNLALIFGLIYIGFRFILNSDDSGAKRNLVTLIIAALLINFSLFFAKAIIDISHIAANSFESLIVVSVNPDGWGGDGISGAFMQTLDITSIFSAPNNLSSGAIWGLIFMTVIVLVTTGFVFAAVGILIAIRFIVLSFLLIFSPIIVLGMIFPNLRGLSSRWFSKFLGQAFMAPAIFLMLYTTLIVLSGIKNPVTGGFNVTTTGLSDLNPANPQLAEAMSAFTFYILGMGFLIGSLIVAQKLGAYGASGSMRIGRNLATGTRRYAQRSAGAATFGMAARGGRATAGRYANNRVNDAGFKASMSKSRLGQKVFQATQKVSDSSFDARKVGGVGKKLGIGEGRKGGYKTIEQEREKSEEKFLKDLGKSDNAREKATRESIETEFSNKKAELDKTTKAGQEKIQQLEQELKTLKDSTDPKDVARREAVEKEKAVFQTNMDLATKGGQRELNDTQEKLNQARVAEVRAQYKNQLNFIEKTDKSWYNDEKDKSGRNALGAGAGVLAGGAAAVLTGGAAIPIIVGIGAAAGVGTRLAVGADANQNRDNTNKLKEKYGENGMKMWQQEQKKDKAESLLRDNPELFKAFQENTALEESPKTTSDSENKNEGDKQ